MKMTPFKWIITIIGLFLMFFSSVLPPVLGLNQVGMATLCIFVGTLLMLIFVDIKWPGLLCILAYATNSIYTLSTAIQLSLGNNIFWYMVLTMIIIGEVVDTGLIRRIAVWMMTRRIAKKNPWTFILMLLFAELVISLFMEPTATMFLFIALMKEIFDVVGVKKGSRVGETLILSALVWSMLGNGATPIGHAIPNVLMGMFEQSGFGSMSYLQFMIPGIVSAIVMFAVGAVLFKFVFRLDTSVFKNYDPDELRKTVQPMSKREKVTGIGYAVVIVLWMLPTCVVGVLPALYTFLNSQLGTCAPLLLVIAALCVIKVDGKPAIDIGKQLANVPWVACIIVGVNMILSASLQNPEAGINEALANAIGPLLQGFSPFLFVLIINILALAMTSFCANMLVATLFSTLSMSLIMSGVITGVNPLALCVTIAMSSNLSYATAASCAPAAVIAGDGWVRQNRQLGDGLIWTFVLGIVGTIVIYFLSSAIM